MGIVQHSVPVITTVVFRMRYQYLWWGHLSNFSIHLRAVGFFSMTWHHAIILLLLISASYCKSYKAADRFTEPHKTLTRAMQENCNQILPFSFISYFSFFIIIHNYSFHPSSYFIFFLYNLLPSSSVLLLLAPVHSIHIHHWTPRREFIDQTSLYYHFSFNEFGEMDAFMFMKQKITYSENNIIF